MIAFLKNILELFGVIYLRFRTVPRLWCVWLVAVNAVCLLFIGHIEAQVVLAVTGVAVAIQALIYGQLGFVRVLGVVHFMWLPMFAWMATRLDTIRAEPELANWLALLLITNAISFLIDLVDMTRFWRGEREPYYHWKRSVA